MSQYYRLRIDADDYLLEHVPPVVYSDSDVIGHSGRHNGIFPLFYQSLLLMVFFSLFSADLYVPLMRNPVPEQRLPVIGFRYLNRASLD